MAKTRKTVPDRTQASQILNEAWDVVLGDDSLTAPDAIRDLVNHEQVAVRFCLPTQLLGKLTDSSLDALSLQRGDGEDGRWDSRSFASRVIVPWNRKNQSVLGGSGAPYVSNPLRRPRLDHVLDQMADRVPWEMLCKILGEVQATSDPERTKQIFMQTLAAIRDRMRELSFVYLLPDRVSLRQAEDLAKAFLAEKSGGDRGLAVAAALFETLRECLKVY
jgi:hypothetical protein